MSNAPMRPAVVGPLEPSVGRLGPERDQEVRASSSNIVRRAAIVARLFSPVLAPKVADLMAQQQSGESAYLQQR